MNEVLERLLVCPDCRSELRWSESQAECHACSSVFRVTNGIPVMLPVHSSNPELKAAQADYFGRTEAASFEVNRPHGTPEIYKWLLREKFRRSMVGLSTESIGPVALTVCGGSGMDGEFLCNQGFTVISTDLSLGAAQNALARAKRYGLPLLPVVADVERLPFRDRSVSFVYVHDGLHHLPDPFVGLSEMMRVTSSALSVTEPVVAVATKVAVLLRIAEAVEEAGNPVARLKIRDLTRSLLTGGFTLRNVDRYAMFYRHEPGRLSRAMSKEEIFPLAVVAWRMANSVFSRLGNKVAVVAEKQPTQTDGHSASEPEEP